MAYVYILDERLAADNLRIVKARPFVPGATERAPQEEIAYTGFYGAADDIPHSLLKRSDVHLIGRYETGTQESRRATFDETQGVLAALGQVAAQEPTELQAIEIASMLRASQQNTL